MILEAATALKREVEGDGPLDAKIVILTDHPSYNEQASKRPLTDYAGRLLLDQFRKAGVLRSQIRIESVCEEVPPGNKFWLLDSASRSAWKADASRRLREFNPNVFVPLGDLALEVLTTKKSCDKWHLSIVETDGIGKPTTKTVPILHPDRIMKQFKDIPFLTFGAQRVAEEAKFPEFNLTKRTFRTSCGFQETLIYLKHLKRAEYVSVDIETGRGQITCIGFASSPYDAICVPTLPRDYSPEEYYVLWKTIAALLGSSVRKIFQNGIYDTTYLSKYGIRTRNFHHDTMLAQKFLHPELPMGLDTIARLYTREPYWKDDAKDWSLRQDVQQLYSYNCKDTSVTYEIAKVQLAELERRGLLRTFQTYLMRMTAPVSEMSWRGLPVKADERLRLRKETEANIAGLELTLQDEARKLTGNVINPRSPNQVKGLLKAAGFRIPMKHGKETSDRESLMRLRLKDPESAILTPLIKLSSEQKRLSSYLSYGYDPDGQMRYSLSLHGTETGRMSCYADPWGNGLNAQTIVSNLKSQYEVTEDEVLVEVDLGQAESRFVAYDAPEPTLIQMFKDGLDIHRFVASQPELFNKSPADVTKAERQLGKKSGHAANYGMQAPTLSAQCLKEMDLVIPVTQAERMLAGYHRTFPGIRRWHARIREEVSTKRMLKTPFGRERVFYQRPGDDLWREAYAYRPQSAVTDVINQLVLHLFGHTQLLLQVHDSCLVRTRINRLDGLLARITDQDAWNPKLRLAGGELRIPIEVKTGRNWGNMTVVYTG